MSGEDVKKTDHKSQYFWIQIAELTGREGGVVGNKIENIYSKPVNIGRALM